MICLSHQVLFDYQPDGHGMGRVVTEKPEIKKNSFDDPDVIERIMFKQK
jgi:hypothetical protein